MIKKIQFLAILIFTSYSNRLAAQIISTDVPDTTIIKSTDHIGTHSYAFDIDHDGIKDFSIAVNATNVLPAGCTITPNMQTELSSWVGTMPSASNHIAMDAGFTASIGADSIIDANSHSWSLSQQNFLFEKTFSYPSCFWDSTINGHWLSDTTSFIGLKFKLGADIHYGYLHIRYQLGIDSLNNSFISVTVLDYAYNSLPDQPILAGEVVINSIDGNTSADYEIKLQYNTLNSQLKIENNLFGNTILEILNISGQIVHRSSLNKSQESIDFSTYPDGTYIYKLTAGKYFRSGRFIKN